MTISKSSRDSQLTDFTPGRIGRNEMDSLADTCVAGANWRIMQDTGRDCSVFGFDDTLGSRDDVIIATCSTVFKDDNGQETLLVAHEMLWFGNKLTRSMINPNQLRHAGVDVQDNYALDLPFGITTDAIHIPFKMKGTKVYFESRCPTKTDLECLPRIILTSSKIWDPENVILQKRTMSSIEQKRIEIEYGDVLGESDVCLAGISSFMTGRPRLDESHHPENRSLCAAQSTTRHTQNTAEELAHKWRLGLETAKETLRVTTQQGIRTAIHPLTRRYRADRLGLHTPQLKVTMYGDTLFSKVKSLDQNTCANVFTAEGYTSVHPMSSKAESGQTLQDLIDNLGCPPAKMVTDLAGELTGKHTEFVKILRRNQIEVHWTESGRKNQNHLAEREIGILKARWKRLMKMKNVPPRLWDYALVYEAEILSRMSRGPTGRTGYERLTGNTPDISEWLDFSFYDRVWFIPEVGEAAKLGRWLGVSHRIGTELCYWILTSAGKVVSKTSVQHVTKADLDKEAVQKQIKTYDQMVDDRLDHEGFFNQSTEGLAYIQDAIKDEGDFGDTNTPKDEDYGDMAKVEERTEADDLDDYDKYVGMQVKIEVDGTPMSGRVIKRATDEFGNKIGRAHQQPMFDSRMYILEMEDGTTEEYTANIIAENVYSQVDEEGRSYELLEEISEHIKDKSAIGIEDGYTISRNGNKHQKKTTRGWKLLCKWKGGGHTWVPLKDLKESNPVELAEYAKAHQLLQEPAFAWWAPTVIKKKQRIISKVQKKYWRTTHKFGIELPHSVAEALAIDERTKTNYWAKAIAKELRKVKVAWKERDDLDINKVRSGKELIGFTEIECHMVFDVKMDFTRKARFVAGGHMTDAPSTVTFSSVVSRDSVRLAFVIAAMNDLDVFACDISNAYLHAKCREKVWFAGGIESGTAKDMVLEVTRALYGLKSSGASWRSTLAGTLNNMGFESTLADPDVWRRKRAKRNGDEYYELILVYVDDILAVGHDAKTTLKQIGEIYEIKDDKIEEPSTYLGGQIYKHQMKDGRSCWAMGSEKYVNNAVKTVEAMLGADSDNPTQLKSSVTTPYPTTYKPELDVSKELDQDGTSRYRQLIGILRWAVELGRLDIYTETSILSQYLAMPREGHLEMVYHIFAYLKKHPKSGIVFNEKKPVLDETHFVMTKASDWKDFYGDAREQIPPNCPEALGTPATVTCFVDSDHAGNVVTRRSHTGVLIYVQKAPIIWLSKRQNTVESSSFGSEFVAMRIATELLVALRYKLRMFGVPLDGPANVLCDNQGVWRNVSRPESTLAKRHNAINYHTVRGAVAAGVLRVGKEDGESNLADAFTKVLGRIRRYKLFSRIMKSGMFDPAREPQNVRKVTAKEKKRRRRASSENDEPRKVRVKQ